jgi:hypothetical protein
MCVWCTQIRARGSTEWIETVVVRGWDVRCVHRQHRVAYAKSSAKQRTCQVLAARTMTEGVKHLWSGCLRSATGFRSLFAHTGYVLGIQRWRRNTGSGILLFRNTRTRMTYCIKVSVSVCVHKWFRGSIRRGGGRGGVKRSSVSRVRHKANHRGAAA